jgi:cell wall-associated NlpC family hydrolase
VSQESTRSSNEPAASDSADITRSSSEPAASDSAEEIQRERVLAEAREWLRTPYHAHARLKGVGVDCAQFPAAVYEAAGIIPHIEPAYARQWHLHRSEELYLAWVGKFAREIPLEDAKPADFTVWRWGRTFSHGGILLGGGQVIHSYIGLGVMIDDIERHEELKRRPRRVFSVWGSP